MITGDDSDHTDTRDREIIFLGKKKKSPRKFTAFSPLAAGGLGPAGAARWTVITVSGGLAPGSPGI